MGKSVPTWLGTRDMTQLAVSAPALVFGGWTKEWGGEGQTGERVGQPFMELHPHPSAWSPASAGPGFPSSGNPHPPAQFKGSSSSPVPGCFPGALLSG